LKKEITLQTRGNEREEYILYFSSIGKEAGDGLFFGPTWEVFVSHQDTVLMGPMHFPRVYITFRIEEDHFEEFLSSFRKAFMRAGA